MTEGNGQRQVYKVSMAQAAGAWVKDHHSKSLPIGQGSKFLSAFRHIIERLRQDPKNFGEQLYRLPALRLSVFQGVVRPLVVDYAIHDELPLVFIRGFKLL